MDMNDQMFNWVVIFLHAKRDANMVAHKLARFGMDMEADKVTHTSPPRCIMQDYMQELVNPMAQPYGQLQLQTFFGLFTVWKFLTTIIPVSVML